MTNAPAPVPSLATTNRLTALLRRHGIPCQRARVCYDGQVLVSYRSDEAAAARQCAALFGRAGYAAVTLRQCDGAPIQITARMVL